MSGDKLSGVVVSKEGSRRFGLGSLRSMSAIKISIIAMVVMALLGGGAYYYFSQENTSTVTTTPKKPDFGVSNAPSAPLKPVDVNYVQLSDGELTSKVNLLMSTKQYAEAEKLITVQTDLTTNKTKLSLLLAVQNVQDKKAEAAQTAAKIESTGNLRAGEYRTMGVQYEEAGNKSKAVEYYRKAIEVYNREKQGTYEDEVKLLETKIRELQ